MFDDRDDAGRQLAERLAGRPFERPAVLALPRGGVPVAAPVAVALDAPLDVFVARKIGAPGQPEFGIGAIAEGGDELVMTDIGHKIASDVKLLRSLVRIERTELDRRVRRYRGGASLPELTGRDVILVDDGLATGVTAEAALNALRRQQPSRLILAAPVCPPETALRLSEVADEVVCVARPTDLGAIGAWYADFTQTTDDEVLRTLRAHRARRPKHPGRSAGSRPGG